jgi:MFS family permease
MNGAGKGPSMTPATTAPAARAAAFSPVVIIGAGSLLLLLVFGIRQGFGLFLPPITSTYGWTREVFSVAIAIQMFMWGAAQPFAGAIADRYGTGRVIAVAGVAYCVGLLLMGHGMSTSLFNLGTGFFIGLGIAGTTFSVVFTAFARVVEPARRSMVYGIGTAMGSFGQFVMVPISQQLIVALGWSGALTALAMLVLLALPLAFVLRGRGEAASAGQSFAEALREASGHSGYWLLTAGYFVCGFHVAFIATHLPAYLVDSGVGAEYGAWALALIGLFNVVGSFTAGVLGGKRRKKYLLSTIYFTRAVVIAVFFLIPLSGTTVILFACAIGLLWLSTVPLTTGLVGQIFGIRYLGMLSGVVFFSHQLGSVCGVWLGGMLFDRTGSYDVVWWISVALGLFAAAVHYPIDDRTVARPATA